MNNDINKNCWIPESDKPHSLTLVTTFVIVSLLLGSLLGIGIGYMIKPVQIQYVDRDVDHIIYQNQTITQVITQNINNDSYYSFNWLNQNLSFPQGNNIYLFDLFVPASFINYSYCSVIIPRNCYNGYNWNDLNITIDGTLITYTNQTIFTQGIILNDSELGISVYEQYSPSLHLTNFDFYFFLTKIS